MPFVSTVETGMLLTVRNSGGCRRIMPLSGQYAKPVFVRGNKSPPEMQKNQETDHLCFNK
jgi:hypothetical protein